MSNVPITVQTSPPTSSVDSFIALLSKSYLKVPLTTAFIKEIDSSTDPSPLTSERLHKHFSLGIPTACKSNIILISSKDFTAAALVEPPDFVGIPPAQARKHPGPILTEWRTTARNLKAKYLSLPDTGPRSYDQPAAPSQSSGGPAEDPYPGDWNKDAEFETRPFYSLAMLGRDPDANESKVKEAVDAVLAPILERAKKEDVPVWTEASTEEKKRENEELGFKVMEEVVIGKGRVDEKGVPKDGGQGVKCWGMIYDQHLQ